MNTFVLDLDHNLNAQYHMDNHVIIMPLEAAQILSAVTWSKRLQAPYKKPSDTNHPCILWCLASVQNWRWLIKYGISLCNEHQYRWGTYRHKLLNTFDHFKKISSEMERRIPLIGLTAHPRIVASNCINEPTVIDAYRKYYVLHKSHLANWRGRSIPEWYSNLTID